VVKQDQPNINNIREHEREKEGQDTMGLIPSPPRCFPSLSFSFPKNSKYLIFLLKKFRDATPNPPKGSHLLRSFFTKHFIPKYSFQTCFVPRIPTYHLPNINKHKLASPLTYPTHVNKLTVFCAGLLNSWTNSFAPGEHDVNPQRLQKQVQKKMTKDANHEGSSQQGKENLISRRNGQGPEHLKFFLLVFFNI